MPPKKPKSEAVRIDFDTFLEVRRLARENGRTVAGQIRLILKDWQEAHKPPQRGEDLI